MIKHIPSNFSPNIFNSVSIHPLQSWEWGEARQKMGVEIVRIGEFKDEKLENVFQLSIHPLGLHNYKIGYLPRSVIPSSNMIRFLYDYGKRNNLLFIKFEPYVQMENQAMQTLHFNIINSSHSLFPNWTQILDITKSEEDLLKGMKPKTRYNIKLAQKKGVIVREESSNDGFNQFSKLYFETCKRQQYYGHNQHYHKTVWETLKDKIAHIFIAYYNDTPLAAYELFYFKDTLYYTYGGTSLENRNFMPANLLMWESIKFGKKIGAKNFDMWGSLPPQYDENHPWAGFTKFKEGYGTRFIKLYGSYDLIINPILYRLYSQIYKLRTFYLSFRRRF